MKIFRGVKRHEWRIVSSNNRPVKGSLQGDFAELPGKESVNASAQRGENPRNLSDALPRPASECESDQGEHSREKEG